MRRSSLPVKATSGGLSRWRALLATVAVALLAGAGIVSAVPAAAEEAQTEGPSLEISVNDCTEYFGSGTLDYTVTGLDPAAAYRTVLSNDVGHFIDERAFVGVTEGAASNSLLPGSYRLLLVQEVSPADWPWLDEQTFTIGACPDLGVSVTPLACSTDRNGEALLTLTGLIPGEFYTYAIEGPGFSVGGLLDEVGETEEIELVGMPPGNYTAYVELVTPISDDDVPVPVGPVFDWVVFVIDPCQPAVVVEVTECTAPGGTGETLLKLSNLVAGVEYEVAVTDRSAPDGTPYGGVHTVTGDEAGEAQLLVWGLPPGRDFTAWVDGVWEAEPWVEPPFIGGGGGFELLETVALSASADFSLKPCPVAPVKPAALPATGSGSTGDLLLGSMMLLGLGGAALLLAARRRSTDAA